jgi:glycosyltransferase involved in cell wall biosynthesis
MSENKDPFVEKLNRPGKANLVIAHWTSFTPLRSGLYETVKELVQEENRMDGVIAGIVDPGDPKGGQADRSTVPHCVAQSHDWAFRDANVHMIHSSSANILGRLKPLIFFLHGSPEACIWSETGFFDRGFSMTSSFQFLEMSAAMIVFMKRHKYFYDRFDAEHKVRLVTKGIDLERWNTGGSKMNFKGKPNILFGEVWREIKDPFVLLFALEEALKDLPEMLFHPWALSDKRYLWEEVVARGRFSKFLGPYLLSGPQAYPEHWYRGGDILVSPVTTGEPSRVSQEALACGCPTISWDTDTFGDNYSIKKAKAFSPFDMASKIKELWEEIEADPEGMKTRCRKIAEEHYDMKDMAKQVVEVVKEVVNKS